eukprot:TRINITY_DN87701_c0_g1_i1.p1 TRINITY_DN87701_c0_g1~~TRINITY_DN87701_c0_g1_i1.p1  ORF type:complete len:251 (-),score=38.85 TRINITY_DN87701_c0_g1_i1:301-1053(-)
MVRLKKKATPSSPSAAQVMSPAEEDENQAGEDEAEPVPETSQLALLAYLKVARGRSGQMQFDDAADMLAWALSVGRKGLTGVDDKPGLLNARALLKGVSFCFVVTLVITLLLLLVRANFTEVETRDGLLLATGLPAYYGEEPVASILTAREFRALASVAALPSTTLRNLRDVTLVHEGSYRCLHVAQVLKYSDSHVWIEAADGAGIRLAAGKAFWREDFIADEVAVSLEGVQFASEMVEPMAFFDKVATA